MSELVIDPRKVDWHGKDRWGRERRFKAKAKNGILVFTPRIRDWRDFISWASGKSQYYASKVMNILWTATSYSFPATLYFALWTTTLTAASTGSTGTEAAYSGYARVAMTANGTNFSTSTSGSAVTNNVAVTFGTNAGGSETETYCAVLDASTAGNIIYWGSITSTSILTGDTPQINTSGMSSQET